MEKQTLLFIPGWGIPNSVYEGFCAELRRYFHVVLLDWKGLRRISEIPAKIRDLLRTQLSPVFTVGHSMGALALIEAALNDPVMIRKMVLVSGTSCFIKRPDGYLSGWDKRVLERMRSKILQNPIPILNDFFRALFTHEEIKKGFLKSFHGLLPQDLKFLDKEGLDRGLAYLIDSDFHQRVKEISIPVLLVHGGEDTICPARASEYIYENLNCGKEYFAVDKAGHMPFMTNKDVVCNILKYLRK